MLLVAVWQLATVSRKRTVERKNFAITVCKNKKKSSYGKIYEEYFYLRLCHRRQIYNFLLVAASFLLYSFLFFCYLSISL